jgi:hypothetical protein
MKNIIKIVMLVGILCIPVYAEVITTVPDGGSTLALFGLGALSLGLVASNNKQ